METLVRFNRDEIVSILEKHTNYKDRLEFLSIEEVQVNNIHESFYIVLKVLPEEIEIK